MNKCVCAWALKALINLVRLYRVTLVTSWIWLGGNIFLSMANSKLLPMQLCSVRLCSITCRLSITTSTTTEVVPGAALYMTPRPVDARWEGDTFDPSFPGSSWEKPCFFRRKVSNWSPWTGDHRLFMTAEVAKVTNFRWIFPPFWQVRSAKWCIFAWMLPPFRGPVIQSDEFLSLACPFIGIDVCIDSTFRWKLRCFRGIIRRSCALLFLSWWIAHIYGIYTQICFVARVGCSR